MNRSELMVLLALSKCEAVSSTSAMTIAEIAEELGQKTNTLYKILTALCKEMLVSNGIKDGRAATYYITKAGITKIGEYA